MKLRGALRRKLEQAIKGKSTKQMERELAELEAREKKLQKREAIAGRMKYLRTKRSSLHKVGKTLAKHGKAYAEHLAKQQAKQARASRRTYKRARKRKRKATRKKTYRRQRTQPFRWGI